MMAKVSLFTRLLETFFVMPPHRHCLPHRKLFCVSGQKNAWIDVFVVSIINGWKFLTIILQRLYSNHVFPQWRDGLIVSFSKTFTNKTAVRQTDRHHAWFTNWSHDLSIVYVFLLCSIKQSIIGWFLGSWSVFFWWDIVQFCGNHRNFFASSFTKNR